MGTLVGGWTKLHTNSRARVRAEMANQFGEVAKKVLPDAATSSGPSSIPVVLRATRSRADGMKGPSYSPHTPMVTRSSTAGMKSPSSSAPNSLPDEEDILGSSDCESSDEDFTDKFVRVMHKGKQPEMAESVHGDDLIIYQSEGGHSLAGDDPVTSQEHGDNSLSGDDRVTSHDDDGQTFAADDVGASQGDGGQSSAGASHDDGGQSVCADEPIVAHNECPQSSGGDVPIVPNDAPIVSEALPSQIPLTVASSASIEDTVVSEASANSDGIASQIKARVISENLVSSLNQGPKVSDVPNLIAGDVVCVYEKRGKKRKLQSVRQRDLEIKGIIVNELGITSAMIQTSVEEAAAKKKKVIQEDKEMPKKETPKRKSIHLSKATRASARLARLCS